MRRMVGDEQDVFRVIVVQKQTRTNPDYRQGNGERPWIYTDGTFRTSYGPYNSIGSARSIKTSKTWDRHEKRLKDGVVATWIEKAITTWEKVS